MLTLCLQILHSETVLFQRQLANLVNVDDIVLLHDDYVRKIVDRCLLNDKVCWPNYKTLVYSYYILTFIILGPRVPRPQYA
jgi:hypothetical protein